MYKYFFLFIFLFSHLQGYSQSEGFRYGARFALGEANISGADLEESRGKLAFSVGITSVYQFNSFFGLEADVLFVSKGSRANGVVTEESIFTSTDYSFEETYNLYYIEIPVMPKISIGFENFYIKFFGGPSFNFNILGTSSREFEDNDYNEENGYSSQKLNGLEVLEFAAMAGAGFDVETPEGIFYIDFRQSLPISSFGEINGSEAKNIYFTIGLGYLF